MNRSDQKTFDVLFKSYSRGMYNICLRMLGNQQDAEDVLQDAFMQAFLSLNQLKAIELFGPWLKRIVINKNIRFLKSRITFKELDEDTESFAEEDPIELDNYSMQRINKEIQQLPDGCRIVFNLFLLENYAHKEIAEELNISESTSKSQYQRARLLLQKRLKMKD